jgi:hypothetical protein
MFKPVGVTVYCTSTGEHIVQLVEADGVTSVDDVGALVAFTQVAEPESGVVAAARRFMRVLSCRPS